MPKPSNPIQNWQRARAQRTGSARERRAAIAMFQPIRGMSPGSLPPDCAEQATSDGSATQAPEGKNMPTKIEQLKDSTALIQPQGQRMTLNLSPAFLMDDPTQALRQDIGKEKVAATIAGDMWGAITHGFKHPNHIDKDRWSIRWCGEIGFRTRTGTIGEADNAYLPATVERKLLNAGAPVIEEGSTEGLRDSGFVAEFSVQFVCEPYTPPPGRSGPPFTYACYNRMARTRNINRLAPPEIRELLPVNLTPPLLGYDPDTGEITEEAAPAEAAE